MARQLLITGATGTLGRALNRISELRGLEHCITTRAELDIAEPTSVEAALDRIRPWAVINTAGYVRVVDAEREPERCYRRFPSAVRPEYCGVGFDGLRGWVVQFDRRADSLRVGGARWRDDGDTQREGQDGQEASTKHGGSPR